jgi:hypothetical protein
MSTFVKTLFLIGAVFTLVGSFVPWQQQGDLVSWWTYGIRIYPSIEDNGGFLIVLMSIIVVMLIFHPPAFIEKPLLWSIVLSVALILDSVFHIGKLYISRGDVTMVVGAPTIQIGLIMVCIGSTLLLFTSMLSFFKSSQ